MSANFNPVLPCDEQVEVISIASNTTATIAEPKVLSTVWKENSENKDKISILKHGGKCFIEIKTQGFQDDDQITLEIKENRGDGEVLKIINLKIKNNEAETDIDDGKALSAEEGWYGKQLIVHVTSEKIEDFEGEKVNVVCCKYAIKRGDTGNLIKELNIRLAGFGEKGTPVPENEFSEKTENAVKQFQRDYMKVMQTGIVCKHFLEKLDEFCDKYYIKIDTEDKFKCLCLSTTGSGTDENHRCSDGFGKERASIKNPEKTGPEKAGVHRSLLWTISAIKFYLDKVETSDGITLSGFSSVYRCLADNIRNNRTTTNHMGNAADMLFTGSIGDFRTRADKVRELFAIYSGANVHWSNATNKFCMEPSLPSYKTLKSSSKNKAEEELTDLDYTLEFVSETWVHLDCREFTDAYQAKEFYCKTESTLRGTTFIDGNLVETSDNGNSKKIKDCTYIASVKDNREREHKLWLGMIRSKHRLKFVDNKTDSLKKWNAEFDAVPKDTEINKLDPRIQDIVEILEENSTQYKIKPRVKPSNVGWVDKTYIREICKHEKTN